MSDMRPGKGPVLAFAMLMAALLMMFLAGCAIGPDYERPKVDLPTEYGVAQSPAPPAQKWWSVFGDPVLDRLVDEALAANYDLKAAAERIEAARGRLAIARAPLTPDVGIQGTISRDRASQLGAAPIPADYLETKTHRLALVASWELDFWGKYRRASEAARSELAATEAGRDAIRASLIGDVIRGYFALEALDKRQEVALRTLETREQAFSMQKVRMDSGVVSELEYRQVESDLRGAQALVPALRQLRIRQEGALALLLGRTPRELYDGRVDTGTPDVPAVEVPAGLPSDLLLRRPDLRQAEELYRKTVTNAFREVRDALYAQTNLREVSTAQRGREAALTRTYELSRLRYDNGAVSLFEVLETERQLLVVRLEAIDAERDRRDAIVDLYLALGAS